MPFIWRYIPVLLAALGADPAASEPAGAPEEPAKPAIVLVEGQAYNHIGAGVAEATVQLLVSTGSKGKPEEKVVATATTNAYGDFKLTCDRSLSGPAVVVFTKQRHETQRREVQLGAPGGPPFVDVEMTGSLAIAGVVKDARTQDPIVGAAIRAEAGYKEWTATTEADGEFEIKGLLPGPVELRVEAEGFARRAVAIEHTQDAGLQIVQLSPERIVHLEVRDAAGKALSGVNVETVGKDGEDYRHLLTAADGKATVRGLHHDAPELQVRLSHEAYVSSAEFDRVVVLPAEVMESTHALMMRAAGVLVGKVTDAATGEPLLGARLTVGKVLDDRLPRAWSDFEGSFRVGGVAPGEAVITVHLSGRAPELGRATVVAGAETRIDFKMSEPRTAGGRLLDKEGAAISGAHVTATRWRGEGTLGLRALSNANGEFEIIDAPQDAFEVSVYASGYKPLLEQVFDAGRSQLTFTLEVDPRARTRSESTRLASGMPAPPFSLTTLDGKTIELAQLKGKVVLLDFWATWCGPCVGEVPALRDAQAAGGKHADFVMISVSLDDDVDALRAFITDHQMNWLHACGADTGANEAADAYGVVAIPALFLIDRGGRIVGVDLRGSAITERVNEALEAE